jgi:hypothetical protein
MSEQSMTVKEIETQFADEWVLVSDPETSETLGVLGGKVLHHSRDRDEVYRRAIALPKPKHYAVLFTGEMPPNTAIVL